MVLCYNTVRRRAAPPSPRVVCGSLESQVEAPLLSTKLFVPQPRPGLVARPRLVERLNEALSFPLVLLSAPAGFGKTTVIAQWIASNEPQIPVAWFQVEEADNDPVRFWDYFIAALRTVKPDIGETASVMLHSPEPYSTESVLTVLVNDITAISSDFAVVLDDYHVIVTEAIHAGMTFLVEHLPAQVHMVIAARVDPPLPLARLRGKGMMLEIHADELRFSLDDATRLFRELKTPKLSAGDISALTERTEGWAVGLKMAGLSMGEQKDISAFITAFSGSQRYVMDYLIEEVLEKQSPGVRDFLVKTSVLERLTAPLCDALTGRTDSQGTLLDLERGHLFLVPLDESRQWFRYEHLFADLLRHRCETIYGKEGVVALHRQASRWYQDNDLHGDAIHHALAARDWETSIRLLEADWESRWKRGEWNTLIGWLQGIPDEILRGHLQLYSHYASILLKTGRIDKAEVALNYLEAVAQDDPALEGEVALTRGGLYIRRGDQRGIELFEKAYALLPPTEIVVRTSVALSIAHFQQRYSNFEEAERWAAIACELGQQAGDTWSVAGAFGQMGIVYTYQGKAKRAAEAFKKSIEFARQGALASRWAEMLCWLQYVMNDLEAAEENARLALESDASSLTALFHLAQICLTRGDATGAETAMKRLDYASVHPTVDSFWYTNYVAFRVLHAIRRDDLDEAVKWGQRFPDLASIGLIVRHVPARLLLAQGKRKESATILQELHDSAAQLGATGVAEWIRVYQAMAADDEESALRFLAEALAMAEPEGFIRWFVDEGKLLGPLLEMALARGITPAFTKKLLDIIDEEERAKQAGERATAPVPFGPLSEREIEVIELVAEGLSNQQIADRLRISLSTAKTHVYHIFDKLDAKDRLHAVERARELKLI